MIDKLIRNLFWLIPVLLEDKVFMQRNKIRIVVLS
jgi:hypothetical protein